MSEPTKQRCEYLALHWRCGHPKGHGGAHEFLGEPPDSQYQAKQRADREHAERVSVRRPDAEEGEPNA